MMQTGTYYFALFREKIYEKEIEKKENCERKKKE
jgi:hypothetical protein